ncbi:hypothetical protein [Massilia soli]|uniref:Uncharacterized protein n=1 Tax=Massilia soli TaxID=2792854 RepID=A0ABS7SVU6_9BURK|nr:hypothetical protein [Massilia soli]MBZ2210072.1 hypothetical protein [Massilia soli]
MTNKTFCVVCKRDDASVIDMQPHLVRCLQCGAYEIMAIEYLQMTNQEQDPLLSAWIRNRTEEQASPPLLTSSTWISLRASLRIPNLREKQAALMKAFARRSMFPGTVGRYNPVADFPLAWAANEGELRFLKQDLIARQLLDNEYTMGGSFLITAKGWDYLDSIPAGGVFSDQVFVAMSFSDTMRTAWTSAIIPAVRQAGYTPYRVDAAPHIDRIDHKIMVEIKASRFLIADVTEQRAGVYFEAGYALGQELPVIWAVREDDLKNVHFDTRQYAHIVWKNERELEKGIYETIVAVIGRGKSH